MSPAIHIRAAIPTDAQKIAEANAAMALETEGKTLDPATLEPGVAALLADPVKGRYWLAERDGEVVGQIMVTWEWSDWRNGWFWWIQSVWVSKHARRQGIYTMLYTTVRDAAIASGEACGLRLYVEKENTGAISTYEALGMRDAGYRMLEIELPRTTRED